MPVTLYSSLPCAVARKKLSAFQDGELSAAWRAQIEEHLAVCPGCRQALVELQSLWLALESDAPSLRPEFVLDLQRRIEAESEARTVGWRRILVRWTLAPAALPALALVGLLAGVWMGSALLSASSGRSVEPARIATFEALDAFAPTPRGSLAEGYLLLTSTEKP